MGTNLPYGRTKTLVWLEAHIEAWSLDPSAIGLTPAQVAQLQGEIAGVRDDFTSVQEVRAHSEATTEKFHSSADDLHDKAADLILAIKSFAATSGNGGIVYLAAGMTPKNAPSPTGAPSMPTNLRAQLESRGNIVLSWDGTGPTGTVYEISRKLAGETKFSLLGNVGALQKTYTDKTLPVGATFATYMIRARRGSTMSAYSMQFNIQFGPTAPPITPAEAVEIDRAA